ncbi:anthrone oxygenase family protein [Brevibacterium zhoupengii]|uniref:anthrone oxygenase family protein n=1 Tax=Brevibacterium zhoupengii TaxID=2898795 RepID=UPI00374D94E6
MLTFAITAGVNVPLNNALDRSTVGAATPNFETQSRDTQNFDAQSQDAQNFDAQSHDAQSHEVRQRFEARWNRWNHVRTLTSLGALACFTAGMALG